MLNFRGELYCQSIKLEARSKSLPRRYLCRNSLPDFFALVPGSEMAPTFQAWEAEIDSLPGIYIPPYEELGFKRVIAPPNFPPKLVPIVVFMECDL